MWRSWLPCKLRRGRGWWCTDIVSAAALMRHAIRCFVMRVRACVRAQVSPLGGGTVLQGTLIFGPT